MVLARVANTLTNGDASSDIADNTGRNVADTMEKVASPVADTVGGAVAEEIDDEAARPPYLHVRVPNRDGTGLN